MSEFNIGKDFTVDPAGRSIEKDGDRSGEALRERYLKPLISELPVGEKLAVKIDDGVVSYGSSFLSSAFGGLTKEGFISASEFRKKILIVFSEENRDTFSFFEDKIYEYVDEGEKIFNG